MKKLTFCTCCGVVLSLSLSSCSKNDVGSAQSRTNLSNANSLALDNNPQRVIEDISGTPIIRNRVNGVMNLSNKVKIAKPILLDENNNILNDKSTLLPNKTYVIEVNRGDSSYNLVLNVADGFSVLSSKENEKTTSFTIRTNEDVGEKIYLCLTPMKKVNDKYTEKCTASNFLLPN
ncbi:MAG: hypothetical protein EAY69_01805 [Cytophagales bacterium]|nr:MAG: hypothetical protein EAY69_01805 [Cytophagales bacterium]